MLVVLDVIWNALASKSHKDRCDYHAIEGTKHVELVDPIHQEKDRADPLHLLRVMEIAGSKATSLFIVF